MDVWGEVDEVDVVDLGELEHVALDGHADAVDEGADGVALVGLDLDQDAVLVDDGGGGDWELGEVGVQEGYGWEVDLGGCHCWGE